MLSERNGAGLPLRPRTRRLEEIGGADLLFRPRNCHHEHLADIVWRNGFRFKSVRSAVYRQCLSVLILSSETANQSNQHNHFLNRIPWLFKCRPGSNLYALPFSPGIPLFPPLQNQGSFPLPTIHHPLPLYGAATALYKGQAADPSGNP